jgi:hypothetical protein
MVTSIERAKEKVIFEKVLEQKKRELGDSYEEYKQQTSEQELLKEAARRNLLSIPDPKKHQIISFIKSGVRIVGYIFLPFSLEIATILLILSEKYYIKKYINLGYQLENKNEGGGGIDIMSQKTKDKIRQSVLGKKYSLETCKKISMALKGKPFSEEHKAKIKTTRGYLKELLQYNLEGNFIKEFASQTEAQYIMRKPNSEELV